MEFPLSRQEYPVLEQIIYLDTPFEGLVARSIWERIEKEVRIQLTDFRQRDANWRYAVRDEVRQLTADTIGVRPDRVALIPGFSFGLRALLPWLKPFRKVLMIENDYPTMIDAFASGSFEMTFIERNQDGSCSFDDLAFAMEQNEGGIFAFSHVFNEVGFRFDPERIAALAHANGVLTVMDVTQSFGSMPLDLSNTGIDIALCSTYKWTGSGFGNGFLTVRPECEKVQGVINQFNTGHLDPFAMLRLKYGLERLSILKLQDIWMHIDELNQLLCDGLRAKGLEVFSNTNAENRSAIVQFEGTEETQQRLEQINIRTSFRGRGIRMGVHWYNKRSDIECLLNAL